MLPIIVATMIKNLSIWYITYMLNRHTATSMALAILVSLFGILIPAAYLQSSACGDGLGCGILGIFALPFIIAGIFTVSTVVLALRQVRFPALYAWIVTAVPFGIQFAINHAVDAHSLFSVITFSAATIVTSLCFCFLIYWLSQRLATVPLIILSLILPTLLLIPGVYRTNAQNNQWEITESAKIRTLDFRPYIHPKMEPRYLVAITERNAGSPPGDEIPQLHIRYGAFSVIEARNISLKDSLAYCLRHSTDVQTRYNGTSSKPLCINNTVLKNGSMLVNEGRIYYAVLGDILLKVETNSPNGNDGLMPDANKTTDFIDGLTQVEPSAITPVNL
jgi:hypothetical protein